MRSAYVVASGSCCPHVAQVQLTTLLSSLVRNFDTTEVEPRAPIDVVHDVTDPWALASTPHCAQVHRGVELCSFVLCLERQSPTATSTCCCPTRIMGRVKREASDDAASAAPRRVRGKARQGGDVATLLQQHSIPVYGVESTPWPQPGRARMAEKADAGEAACRSALAEISASLQYPSRTHLMQVGWEPPSVVWQAPCTYTPTARPTTSSTPLALSVETHAGMHAVAWQPYEAVSLGTYESAHGSRSCGCTAKDPSSRYGRARLRCGMGTAAGCGAWYVQAFLTADEWLMVACANERNAHAPVEGSSAPRGMLQLWSCTPATQSMSLACSLHLPDATPLRIAWRPGPPQPGTLGTLAIATMQGPLYVVDVPATFEAASMALHPSMTLHVPTTSCCSLAWGGPARLAAGCTNGHLAVWDLDVSTQPLFDALVHDTVISAVSWQALPSVDEPSARPHILFSVGWDGSEYVTDLYEPYAALRLAHSREPRYATTWMPWCGAWALDMGDGQFGSTSLRVHDIGHHHALGFHYGRVMCMAASSFHPYLATGSADGSVKVSQALSMAKRKAVDEGSRVRRRHTHV